MFIDLLDFLTDYILELLKKNEVIKIVETICKTIYNLAYEISELGI
jgi:hypothetical protein